MINVSINNFRKIKEASFSIAPIALLVGENENGKSSIAQAVALAAAQQALPRTIAKKDAKMLVHDGAKSGKIELSRDDVSTSISWPLADFKVNGQGRPVQSSDFAVGLKSIFGLSNTERVSYFISLLKANPTLDDLKIKLPKSLDHLLPEIWKQIGESGWDEAHSTAKTDESELTGQWKSATGETRWNVSSAGDWRPGTRLRDEVTLAQHQLTEVEKAKEKLDNLGAGGAAMDVEAMRTAYAKAERRLDDFNAFHKARQLYERILTQKELVTALGQGGVRKEKLDQQIKKFCEEVLQPLSNAYGCERVWLDNDLEIWRGNRRYSLLSRSARYAVRIIIQVAIAMADRSELLVIDDVDEINDRRNRAGLMSMVASTGIPALVCMAKRPEENAPDLAARGTGQTYTVIEGVVQPFNAQPAQEAQSS